MTPKARLAAFAALAGAGALVAAFNVRSLGPALLNLPTFFSRTGLVRNIAYGQEPSQRLDIYLPAGHETRNLPVIVFFYGGRWMAGQKEIYRFAGDAFAKRGFIVAIPDYAKYPAVRFPAFAQDGAKALAWVSDHVAEYGGNPARIFVAGHSAGAHIGALLAANPAFLANEGRDRGAVIRGFAGLAGPYAFTPDEPDLIDMFGPPECYPAMQVTTFIDGTQPPMLLLYGDADTTVRRYNLDRLEAKIQEKGGAVKSIIYPGIDHLWIVGTLGWLNWRGPAVASDITAFFASLK